jgi:hypothetical protein
MLMKAKEIMRFGGRPSYPQQARMLMKTKEIMSLAGGQVIDGRPECL